MKKLILSILLIIISVLGFAQTFPIITPIGSKPTMLNNQGTFKAPGYTYASFTDTTEANASSYLKFTPGIIILTGYTNLWVRNSAATAWVQISGSGGGGTLTSLGGGIPVGITSTNNTNSLAAGYGTLINGPTANLLTFVADTATLGPYFRSNVNAFNGLSNTTSNIVLGGSDLVRYSAIGLNGFPLNIVHNGVNNAAQSDSNALSLRNNNVAASTTDSLVSPKLRFYSSGRKTLGGAAGQPIAIEMDLLGTSGSTTPAGLFRWFAVRNTTRAQIFSMTTAGVIPDPLTLNGARIGNSVSSSVFFGPSAGLTNGGGTNAIAIGTNALTANSTGAENTAVGWQTLSTNSTGSFNVALGSQSLTFNNADFNTALGFSALEFNTSGSANTAVGTNALNANTTAQKNTAIGGGAMEVTTTGGFNTAVGEDALLHNISGTNNIAIGWLSGALNPVGTGNVSIGFNAGTLVASGDNNTFLGTSAGNISGQEDTVTHSISIGANSFTTASNQMVLGSTNILQTKIFGSRIGSNSDSIYTRRSDGTLGAVAQSSIIGATPTLQQVLTAGSSISSGSQSITGTGSNLLNFTNFDEFDISNMTGNSHFGGGGIYNFDADLNVNDILKLTAIAGLHNAADSMLVWNPSTNLVGYRPIPSSGSGTVTSVSFTGGLISVANPTTTPAFTVAGTSGGGIVFTSASTWASTGVLAANALMIGGGAGVAYSTTTTGTGVLTALGINVGSAGAFVTFNGALGTPSSGTLTNATGYLWNNIASPTGTQTLSWPDASLNAWTNGSNTETFTTITSNSLTTGIVLSMTSNSQTYGNFENYNSTSTAKVTGNALSVHTSSGANATASVTNLGDSINIINTGTTSTNIAMKLGASGAATANIALQTFAGNVLIGAPTNNTLDALIIQSPNNTIGNGLRLYANNNSTYAQLGYGGILNPGAFIIQSSSTTTLNLSGGKVFVGAGTTPTAILHLLAGTTAATTAPFKFTTGSLMTTAEIGGLEYNNALYSTNNAINRVAIGGTIADFTSDVNNGTTVETDIYTYTTKASTLAATGEKIIAQFTGTFNDITATAQLQCYFGGTNIGNTGALTIGATGAWVINITVIRTGSSTARASVNVSTPSGSTALYTAETDITGLTFTNTNIIKCTATAGGASGGSNDITGKLGWIQWHPAANN